MLKALRPGDMVVVTRLDRLARSTRDLLNILDQVTAAGASFKSLADAWCDTTTAHGKLLITTKPGQIFVPLRVSAAQAAVYSQIRNLRTQYQSFGGNVVTDSVVSPAGPGARNDLNRLMRGAEYDSLGSTDHTSMGDISIGARFQLANTFPDSSTSVTSGLRYRLAVAAAGRFGTGQPARSLVGCFCRSCARSRRSGRRPSSPDRPMLAAPP